MPSSKLYIGDLHPSERRWFPVRTGFRKEKAVSAALKRSGIEVFLPLRKHERHYASKTVVRQIPLLSGYLFVCVHQGEISKVLANEFVYNFVKIGPQYKQVTAKEMEQLRYLCDETGLPLEELAEEQLPQAGTLMEIRRGPLAGMRGRLAEYKNKDVFLIAFGELDTRLALFEINAKDLFPLRELAEA